MMKLLQKFNTQTFTQGSAVLKVLYYNPKDIIHQHLPVKEVDFKARIK